MASKESIITLPHTHLRQPSSRVGIIDDEIKTVIADMKAATLDWEDSRKHELGVALAAVQIDYLHRIVVVRQDFEDKKNREFGVFINPEIVKLEGPVVTDYEGCLSIRDIYGKVPRRETARIKALNEQGQIVRLKAKGFLSRVFQHEIDHTNGVLFIDHIKDDESAFYHLNEDGKLDPLDYSTDIAQNPVLWQS